MKSLIFDLDQTLIDSSNAETLRSSRQWNQVYETIPTFTLYEGMLELFEYVTREPFKICIVTTSPSAYCNKVLRHWNIPFHHTVCYHDVIHRKPHPESMVKALKLLKAEPQNTFSFGDRVIDIRASKAAGIPSIGCLWGSTEQETLIAEQPDHLIYSPREALALLQSFKSK